MQDGPSQRRRRRLMSGQEEVVARRDEVIVAAKFQLFPKFTEMRLILQYDSCFPGHSLQE